jgi:hypothetical protein
MANRSGRVHVMDTVPPIPGRNKKNIYWFYRGYRKIFKDLRPGLDLPGNIKTSQDLIELIQGYGFRGVEFGNWLTEEDRFVYLVALYFAIYDMNKILGFGKNMGMDKMISIGFGSRGVPKSLAHFNSATNFININRYDRTHNAIKPIQFVRSGGISSFAHEYGHALDYILGGYVERNRELFSLTLGNSVRTQWLYKSFNTPMRRLTNELLHAYIWEDEQEKKFTRSYENIHGERPYYRQHNEIFARLFEKYLWHKLQQRHIKNLGLTKGKYDLHVYVTDRDMKKLIPIMDKLVRVMAQHITAKQKTATLPAPRLAAEARQTSLF